MADKAEVRVIGFDELVSGSEQLVEKIGETALDKFREEAEARAEEIRGRMPHDSGTLAGSVTASYEDGRWTVGIPDKSEAPYAGWIEFGGIREGGRNATAERPYIPEGRYIFPIAQAAEPQLVDAGTKAAEDEIGGFPWKSPSG